MTSDVHQADKFDDWADRGTAERVLPEDEIRRLDRDLRILIACNGTLTRTLGIVTAEEIAVDIVDQQFCGDSPWVPVSDQQLDGRVLQRRVFLKGRSSGQAFVAAESLVAVDLLPAAIATRLMNTDHPIGEVMAASFLESFKEAAKVWSGPPPAWLDAAGYRHPEPSMVGRRYRVITGGQPAIVITEYFLRPSRDTC
jgi:chorismate--pyruvate lyase